ncbi:MAG: glycosyltransferase family 39 protein [Candidatus Brocadiia bacterium]
MTKQRADKLHDTARGPSRTARMLTGYPMVAALLAIHFVLAVTSVMDKCATSDEMAHLPAGYCYWIHNDYRLNPENGNLPQRWCALPLLLGRYAFPADTSRFWTSSNVWPIGHQFFYLMGNDVQAMLLKGRAFTALLSVALGLIVYFWSRRLFGPTGGMISLALYVFNPTMLANGSLVTSDMAAALFFTASLWAVSIMVNKVTAATVLASALAMAGLFLSKFSAVLIIPVAVVLMGLQLFSRESVPAGFLRPVEVKTIRRRAAIFAGTILVHAVIIVAVIWAFFGFRYSAFRTPDPLNELYPPWIKVADVPGLVPRTIHFFNSRKLLPEAYLFGFANVYRGSLIRRAFLNGEYSLTGWRSFFPYTFLVKTPLVVFLVLALALAAAVRKTKLARKEARQAAWAALAPALYRTAPLWVLLVVYWATAIFSHINIGHRHIMPVYPPLFILAGAAAHWVTARERLLCAALVGALLIGAAECALAWPDYIPYFNAVAGGSKNGYRHLVDSSLDWGQDLPGLKEWLARQHLDGNAEMPVYFAYFGNGNPRYYHIPGKQLPGFPDMERDTTIGPLTGGIYCISATVLQQVLSDAPGRWTAEYEEAYQQRLRDFASIVKVKDDPVALRILMARGGEKDWNTRLSAFDTLRMARLCAFLRQREPDDEVHYSILIYRLTDEDARKVVYGPPPELAPALTP